GAGARAGGGSADPDPRRFPVVRRRGDGAHHPDPAAADPGGAHVDPDLAPGGGGEGRRPDPGPRRRPRRRNRHARGAARVGRRLRVAVPRAARPGGGGVMMGTPRGSPDPPAKGSQGQSPRSPARSASEDLLGNALDRTLLRRIFAYVWPYRRRLFLAAALL